MGQYISRAEELKALVTSDSKNLLQQGSPAREVLKGGVLFFFGGKHHWEPAPRGLVVGRQAEGTPKRLPAEMAKDKPRLCAALEVAAAAMARVSPGFWGASTPGVAGGG